jgi:hypothetical protein
VALDTAADPALPSASEIDAPADVAAGLPEQAEAAEAIQPGPAADVQGTPDPTADDAGDSQAGEAGLVDDLSEFVATETTDAPEDLSQEPAPDAHVNGASADFEDLIDAPQPAADGSGDNDADPSVTFSAGCAAQRRRPGRRLSHATLPPPLLPLLPLPPIR